MSISGGSLTDSSGSINFANANLTTTATIQATHFTVQSDARLKDNVAPLTVGLEALGLIDGKTFDWLASGKPDTGLIAQEVLQVAPEAVLQDPVSGMYSVDYSRMVPYLVHWVKLLAARP